MSVAIGVLLSGGAGGVLRFVLDGAVGRRVGGYSTFSTWMLETQRLEEERQLGGAVANIGISMAIGLAAAFLGQWIAAAILGHSIGARL